MAKKKLSLLLQVLIAIAAGCLCSLFFPHWLDRIFVTFCELFNNFFSFFVPILIVGLVAPAISDIGKGAGKLLLLTVLIAYGSTVFAGSAAFFTCRWSFPTILSNNIGSLGNLDMTGGLKPYFTIEIPSFINVTSALVLSFVLGLTASLSGTPTMKGFLDDLRSIVMTTIEKVIIPLLPVVIYSIFLKIGADGQVISVITIFMKIICVILVIHVVILVLYFCIAGAISGRNPFKSLLKMMPAYATALGSRSSAATIPVTLKCTKSIGVKDDIVDFVIPLCATMHMPGSIMKIVSCAYAITFCSGADLGIEAYIGFIMMASITMVAAPGIPGGAIMASLGLIGSMLGMDSDMQGIILAVYIAIDGFGTAGNVTGDGAVAMVIERIQKKKGDA